MTNPEHDEGFEAYLKRRSVLTNALDDRLEPPAALDEVVLRRAHEAIKGQAASGATQQTVRAPRWAMPVALAATILLCLSVVLNISLNTNRPSPDPQRSTAARANVNPGATADARGDGRGDARGDARGDGRGDGRTTNDGERQESVSGDVPSREVVLTEAKVAGSPALREPVVADSAQGAPPPAPTRLASAGGPASAGEPAAPSDFASPTPPASTAAPAPSAFRSSATPPASAATPAPSAFRSSATPSASAAAPAPSEFRSSAMPRASAASSAPLAKRADAASPGSATATEGAANAPTLADAAPHPADPSVWLKQIAALRAAGETDRADTEMRRFRTVFPGYAASPTPPAASEPPK